MLCSSLTVSASAQSLDYRSADYEKIDTQLEDNFKQLHIPAAAVIVVDKDRVLFSQVYGECESTDTPFLIGSMSKSYTALAVTQLTEQGKIEPDSPITDYIDCSQMFKDPSQGERITVRQLLNQTSGISTNQKYGDMEITDNYGNFEYSNSNYSLLGSVIENVSGMSYSEYMEENIFLPLGLEHTSAQLEDIKADGLIRGYRNFFGVFIDGEPDYPEGVRPSEDSAPFTSVAGGYLGSSVSDMGRYLQMYLNGGEGLVSGESIDTMFAGDEYGFGWFIDRTDPEDPIYSHSGLDENYTSNMLILPKQGIGIVILTDINDYLGANNLLEDAVAPLFGQTQDTSLARRYLTVHALLDLVYLLMLGFALYPVIRMKKWKNSKRTAGSVIFDIFRHLLVPAVLLILPPLMGTPLWLIWFYVKDLAIVLMACISLLIFTGIYKAVQGIFGKKA